MITYKYEKEKEIVISLARKLSNSEALAILEEGQVDSDEQAICLARFYWQVVDELIRNAKSGSDVCGEQNLEEWSELIMASFRSYLRNNGYSSQWDSASDDA